MTAEAECIQIYLLPALPEAWNDGLVRGLRARGGLEVDMVWKQRVLVSATIKGTARGTYQFSYNGKTVAIDITEGKSIRLDGRLSHLLISA